MLQWFNFCSYVDMQTFQPCLHYSSGHCHLMPCKIIPCPVLCIYANSIELFRSELEVCMSVSCFIGQFPFLLLALYLCVCVDKFLSIDNSSMLWLLEIYFCCCCMEQNAQHLNDIILKKYRLLYWKVPIRPHVHISSKYLYFCSKQKHFVDYFRERVC